MPPDRPCRAARAQNPLTMSSGGETWQRRNHPLAAARRWGTHRTTRCLGNCASRTPSVPRVAPGFWRRPSGRTSLGSPAEWEPGWAPLEIPSLVNSPRACRRRVPALVETGFLAPHPLPASTRPVEVPSSPNRVSRPLDSQTVPHIRRKIPGPCRRHDRPYLGSTPRFDRLSRRGAGGRGPLPGRRGGRAPQTAAHQVAQLPGELLRHSRVFALGHDPDERLRAGGPDEHAPPPAQAALGLGDRALDLGIIGPPFRLGHPHVEQDLRIADERRAQLLQRAPALQHHIDELEGRDQPISGRGAIQEDHVPALLAPTLAPVSSIRSSTYRSPTLTRS